MYGGQLIRRINLYSVRIITQHTYMYVNSLKYFLIIHFNSVFKMPVFEIDSFYFLYILHLIFSIVFTKKSNNCVCVFVVNSCKKN